MDPITVYVLVILIYVSFGIDLIGLRVPSEASTKALLSGNASSRIRMINLLSSVLAGISYILPLVLAIYYDLTNAQIAGIVTGIAGIVIALSGRIITLWAAWYLRKQDRPGLLTGAIFRFSRNPLSLGLHLTLFGVIVALKNWWLLPCLLFFLYHIDRKIRMEEKHLEENFGNAYLNYKTLTNRYFGRRSK